MECAIPWLHRFWRPYYWVPNTTMHVNGAPGNTFGIKLDGQDITNGVNTSTSQAQTQPSVDALQEVAIQASNYSAEFGQAGSGLIQYTTRSGTSSFHGSAYDYFVNEALYAHQSFDHARNRNRRNDLGDAGRAHPHPENLQRQESDLLLLQL